VTAAGFADIGARDPHPLVLGGRVNHAAQQLAIARLQLLALVQGLASGADPFGQRIPHPLKLFQSGDARLTEATRDHGIDIEARKGLGPQARQLMLEPTDLAPQLSARKPLIASNLKRSERVWFKHVRHKPRPSVDHRPATESENHVKARGRLTPQLRRRRSRGPRPPTPGGRP
jgi:hypothetical protein